jgi:RNA polymerase sigma factor (sigma-70 family)
MIAKSKYGEKYQQILGDAFFEYYKYNIRTKGPQRTYTQSLIAQGIFSEDEFKLRLHRTPKKLTSFDKAFNKYNHLVKYFVFLHARIIRNHSISNEDVHQECWMNIYQNVDFTLNHHAIMGYIAKVVKTVCLRLASRSAHIRIPDYSYTKALFANLRQSENWEYLLKPGHRFVKYLEDSDISNLREPIPENKEYQYSHLKASLDTILDSLSPKQRIIIIMRYGLRGQEPHSLESIGKLLNFTRERVRQIEEQVIRIMRQKLLSDSDVTPIEKGILRKLQLPARHFRTSTFRHYVSRTKIHMVG